MIQLRFVRAIAVVVCAAALISGCGNDGGPPGAAEMSVDPNEVDTSAVEGKYFYQMPRGEPGQGMTLELKPKLIASATRPGGRTQQGTYRLEPDAVIVSLQGDGANTRYAIVGDNLSTTFYGGTEEATFVRQ